MMTLSPLLTQTLPQWYRRLLAVPLPPQCIACGVYLAPTQPPGLCPACYGPRRAFDLAQQPALQDWLKASPIKDFRAAWLYDEVCSGLVSRLKFHDASELATPLARVLLPAWQGLVTAVPQPQLVPVPLHPSRLRERRYNQAALLAKRLSQLTGAPWWPEGLRRQRPTPHQTGQSRATRLRQLAGAFRANPQLAGQHVVLLDDVFTTGSTALACARALQRGGVASVRVLTLAYVE